MLISFSDANKSEIEDGIKAIKHLSCFQKSLLCRNACWVHNKRGEPVEFPQEQPEIYPWHLNLPPCPGRAEPAAGLAHIPPALWDSWTICCLWGKELNSASCRENNFQVGRDGYFHSITSCLRCGWQGKDAPHSTESPNSILTEHSHPWMYEVVYFQGVGTKGACGNSLSNQHLFLAMAVTIADEASVTPRPSIFWNSRDAVSTGWGNWVFFHHFAMVPDAHPWLLLLSQLIWSQSLLIRILFHLENGTLWANLC